MPKRFTFKVQPTDSSEELGIIWGYASVADLLDRQGDIIPQDELVRAVYEFMEAYYAGTATIRENHQDEAAAVLVESTLHFLGTRVAWFVGVKLYDPDLLADARAGKIPGFSIGGFYESDDTEEKE